MTEKKVHKKAIVKAVEYLNWKCRNTIYCLASELKLGEDGTSHIVERQESEVRFHTKSYLISVLMNSGWVQVIKNTPRSPLYYWKDNNSTTARLRFHGKGIDVQFCDKHVWMDASHDGREVLHVTDGKIARHRYYHSKVCIFEFIAEFATAFSNNEERLDLYLAQIGKDGPKKSDVCDFQVGSTVRRKDGNSDGLSRAQLYEIMSDGGGGPAYLGDGLYFASDESISE